MRLCSLIVFLCDIRSLMFWGSSLYLLLIFPFGMWCLSSLRMMFVIIVLLCQRVLILFPVRIHPSVLCGSLCMSFVVGICGIWFWCYRW